MISSSTTSLWYRISFNAAIASSSGDLMRVGPKTIPRFSAFIRFSFSWRVTLKNRSKGVWLRNGHALKQKPDSQEVCAHLSTLLLGYFSVFLLNFKVLTCIKLAINNLNFSNPNECTWQCGFSFICGFPGQSLELMEYVCKQRNWVVLIIPSALSSSPLWLSCFL